MNRLEYARLTSSHGAPSLDNGANLRWSTCIEVVLASISGYFNFGVTTSNALRAPALFACAAARSSVSMAPVYFNLLCILAPIRSSCVALAVRRPSDFSAAILRAWRLQFAATCTHVKAPYPSSRMFFCLLHARSWLHAFFHPAFLFQKDLGSNLRPQRTP